LVFAVAHDHFPVRKTNGKSSLVESYCPGCGIFIAASGHLPFLEIAEKGHRCPSLASLERGLDVFRKKKPAVVPVGQATNWAASDARVDPPLEDQVDRLLLELARKQQELDEWLRSSETHARWFRKDPVGAIRAANLGIAEEVLTELEAVTAAIVQKLKAGSDSGV
jgi:hypothetical protein